MRVLGLFVVFFAMAIAHVSAGTDEGLYAPKAPEGSAFVRFVNLGDNSVEIGVNGKSYGNISALQASPYFVFSKGDMEFYLDDNKMSKTIEAGNYYTVTAIEEVLVIVDTANADRTKATLALYNLREGENTISMKAKGGSVSVLENIAVGKSGTRDINPIKIDPTVHIMVAGGNEYSKLAPIAVEPFIMERGNHYSIFYNGKDAFVVTASVDTTR